MKNNHSPRASTESEAAPVVQNVASGLLAVNRDALVVFCESAAASLAALDAAIAADPTEFSAQRRQAEQALETIRKGTGEDDVPVFDNLLQAVARAGLQVVKPDAGAGAGTDAGSKLALSARRIFAKRRVL